jgi:hypothetical protein
MNSQVTQTGPLTTPALVTSEIGSDFELVDDRYLIPIKSRPLPWETDSDIIYVESGRQALAVVETELRAQGHTRIYVPSYLCDTMISPFMRNHWTLTVLPVDNDLVVRPTDLLARVTGGVLLHTPYFGRQDSPAMMEALDTIRRRGVVVVVDETHRVFSGPSPVADIRVASLRKLLPLYDGGYVAGLSARLGPTLQTSPAESDIVVFRRLAMRTKSASLASGDDSKAHLELFARAEHATETRTQPARMSGDSLSLLHCLDMELIRATREMNSISLARALGQSDRFRVINCPTEDLLPSHIVLETDDVIGLREYLIGHRIYCPIHWPPSELLPRTGSWPGRYISLPIDHRYRERDMLRMADSIKTFSEIDQKGSVT